MTPKKSTEKTSSTDRKDQLHEDPKMTRHHEESAKEGMARLKGEEPSPDFNDVGDCDDE